MKSECVSPERISEGDVIGDPAGARWITVSEIRVLADGRRDVFSFYGSGPDDRITVGSDELIERKQQ